MSQKILVVDDDAGIRDTLRMILEYEGYEVATSPDGKTALADLDSAPADAVLLAQSGWECTSISGSSEGLAPE